jgi:hypothetical protein
MNPETISLSQRIEEVNAVVADVRHFITEVHDRLLGPQPTSVTASSLSKPAPASQLDTMHQRLNEMHYNLDEIRTMVRSIGGRI